ncbi:MAG: LysR family transcriptional regulator [Amphritea sp.]
MDTLVCIKAFVTVVEEEGFSAAGRKLGWSKHLVSKYVGQLENSLGVRLLHRTTRQVSMTTLGRAYLERCKPLLEEFQALQLSVQDSHSTPQGELVISAPTTFAELHLMGPVSDFMALYPDIQINMQLSDRYVDIVEEGLDVAIRIGDLPDSSLIARKLADLDVVICAAPEYLAKQGTPEHPEQLAEHTCLIDSNLRTRDRWPMKVGDEVGYIKVAGNMIVNSAAAMRVMALDGHGLGMFPGFVVGGDIATGRLVPVLSEYCYNRMGVYALYSHRRHLSAKVRLLIDHLIKHFENMEQWLIR